MAERAAKIVAAYKLTAFIASKAFGISVDVKWIEQFLLSKLNQSANRDNLDEIYDYFLEYVENNKNLFHSGSPKDRKFNANRPHYSDTPDTPYHSSKKKVLYLQ